ncbi:MAG: competence protein CoiA family protein [Acidobacteriota bacterium]
MICPVALSKDNQLVWAADALRGDNYFCPVCSERVIPRLGEIRRPHFAHFVDNSSCASETLLHVIAKRQISEAFKTAVEGAKPYRVSWPCVECHLIHHGDLAKPARTISVEKRFHGVRPDLLIEHGAGEPVAAIEVVVAHSPERETTGVYSTHGLPVLITRPTYDELLSYRSHLGHVEAFNAPCKARHCERCDARMRHMELRRWDGYRCYNCGLPMSILEMIDLAGGIGESRLPIQVIGFARTREIKIAKRYSRTMRESYPVHICRRCNRCQGDHYTRPAMWATEEDYSVVLYYWNCLKCDVWKPTNA